MLPLSIEISFSTEDWSSQSRMALKFSPLVDITNSNTPMQSDIISDVVNITSGALKVSDFVVATTTTTNPTRNDYEIDDDIIF